MYGDTSQKSHSAQTAEGNTHGSRLDRDGGRGPLGSPLAVSSALRERDRRIPAQTLRHHLQTKAVPSRAHLLLDREASLFRACSRRGWGSWGRRRDYRTKFLLVLSPVNSKHPQRQAHQSTDPLRQCIDRAFERQHQNKRLHYLTTDIDHLSQRIRSSTRFIPSSQIILYIRIPICW